ncbi:uncharacterized PE-PGRS family protein PE_PGRS10-like isoform X1 [Daphnia pulicaria]|uniref:uncharacterized PE-PGRS family protein PE_PGRS10-like isoform X1 n=1 Tax=Daphnia pulicaria TaxID=35523 RepID=UPI001EEA99CB|nr:uncharacterized PE-PGRS family protein PE_PGRS10-like isoform X1 [Daphnia pulicaria]
MWRFVQISVVCLALLLPCVLTKSISAVDKPDLPDANLLLAEFYHTVEAAVNHLVVSRDMHKLVRERRQLNNFGGGNFGQGGLGGLGGFGQQGGGGAANLFTQSGLTGDLLGGLSNVANLASLGSLTSDAASGIPPVLQGVGYVNNMVKTVVGLDRMKCTSRLACEYMANRGLFNRTSALVPPTVFPALNENAQGALNLSHPSTFRSILGVLQLMRFQEFGAYGPIEAALWGVAHRDNTRCRDQFSKCPSTAEAFITELNSTPGGLQSMLTTSLQAIRNTLPDGASSAPETAANVADIGSSLSNFGQQAGGGLGSLSGLGGLGGFGGNQQFLNPSGSQFGNNQQLLNGAQFGGNQQFLNPSGSQFGGNQQLLNGVAAQFGGNQQFANPSLSQLGGGQQFLNPSAAQFGNLGSNFASTNFGQQGAGGGLGSFGNQQQFLDSSQLGGNQQFLNPSFSQFGGNQQFAGSAGLQFSGLGSNFASTGVSNFNPGFGSGLNGANGLNSLGGFGGVNGLSGLSGGSQFAGQGFQQGSFGGFNGLSGNFRSGADDDKKANNKKKWTWG